jgi:hypothetical protein
MNEATLNVTQDKWDKNVNTPPAHKWGPGPAAFAILRHILKRSSCEQMVPCDVTTDPENIFHDVIANYQTAVESIYMVMSVFVCLIKAQRFEYVYRGANGKGILSRVSKCN